MSIDLQFKQFTPLTKAQGNHYRLGSPHTHFQLYPLLMILQRLTKPCFYEWAVLTLVQTIPAFIGIWLGFGCTVAALFPLVWLHSPGTILGSVTFSNWRVYTSCDTSHTQLIYRNLHSDMISTYSDTILGSLYNSTRYEFKLLGGD